MFLSLVFVLTSPPSFAGPANPGYEIICKKYLPGSNEELPDGISLSYDQRVQNFLKCYNKQVLQAEKDCKKLFEKSQCENRTNQWINKTFLLNPRNQQVAQGLGRCNRRRNLMMNIRDVR